MVKRALRGNGDSYSLGLFGFTPDPIDSRKKLAGRNDGFTPGKMPCAKQGIFQHANGRKIFYVNFYRDTPYNLCNLRPLSN